MKIATINGAMPLMILATRSLRIIKERTLPNLALPIASDFAAGGQHDHFAGLALGLVVCTGCAGRAPNPVSVVQVQDRHMDCPAIFAEVQSNNQRVQELAEEQGFKVAQNVVTGVAGFIIPVLWFGMD